MAALVRKSANLTSQESSRLPEKNCVKYQELGGPIKRSFETSLQDCETFSFSLKIAKERIKRGGGADF